MKIIRVKAGDEAAFEALFAELRAKVREAEPGCRLYSLLKSRSDPRSYIVHEQYDDPAALAAHQTSAHGKVYFPTLRDLIENITVEYFDGIVE